MRIFVAGATGTLGQAATRALRAAGHDVSGSTRIAAKAAALRADGVRAYVGDVFDADGIRLMLSAEKPDVVVHLLTALPPGGPRSAAQMRQTNRVRIAGTANLLGAAIGAGARRFVAESFVAAYGTGDLGSKPLAEDELSRREVPPPVRPTVEALRSLEQQVVSASQRGLIEGVVLRFGLFYGAAVPSTTLTVEGLRRRRLPIVGGGSGFVSLVHVEDAASAIVAAVEHGRAGEIYNIVDDQPIRIGDMLRTLARAAGTPRPPRVPAWIAHLVAPFLAHLSTASIPLSNAKAKRDLSWTPKHATFVDGIAGISFEKGK